MDENFYFLLSDESINTDTSSNYCLSQEIAVERETVYSVREQTPLRRAMRRGEAQREAHQK